VGTHSKNCRILLRLAPISELSATINGSFLPSKVNWDGGTQPTSTQQAQSGYRQLLLTTMRALSQTKLAICCMALEMRVSVRDARWLGCSWQRPKSLGPWIPGKAVASRWLVATPVSPSALLTNLFEVKHAPDQDGRVEEPQKDEAGDADELQVRIVRELLPNVRPEVGKDLLQRARAVCGRLWRHCVHTTHVAPAQHGR